MEEKTIDINEGRALIFEDDNGCFTLTPRGCLASALIDVGIADSEDMTELNDNRKFGAAFNVLVKRFKEYGWIEGGGEEPSGTSEDQKSVFMKTIGVYFKNADEDELEAAFDEFMDLLEKHENTN